MNYYNPNYYAGYNPLYGNINSPINNTPSYSGNVPYANTQQSTMPAVPAGLNGKIVDSLDVVKVTEVPIGGYGLFPKADLSEIYVKSWNNNGTTSILTFKPIAETPEVAVPQKSEEVQKILEQMKILENKIDNLALIPQTTVTSNNFSKESTINSIKKETKANDY